MDIRTQYSLEIQTIQNDLTILINSQVYEIEKCPGVPSVSTVGKRLLKNLNDLLGKIDHGKPGMIEEFGKYFNEV